MYTPVQRILKIEMAKYFCIFNFQLLSWICPCCHNRVSLQKFGSLIKKKKTNPYLCEILLVEAKKVLLNIILIRKNLICIYFQHTFTFATTKRKASGAISGSGNSSTHLLFCSHECKSVLKVNANEVSPYQYDNKSISHAFFLTVIKHRVQ